LADFVYSKEGAFFFSTFVKIEAMNWKHTQSETPERTGSYIVSIRVERSGNATLFTNATAYYDKEANRWYKYDPFTQKHSVNDDITAQVTGWLEDPGVVSN
jgi:hypothetical protein